MISWHHQSLSLWFLRCWGPILLLLCRLFCLFFVYKLIIAGVISEEPVNKDSSSTEIGIDIPLMMIVVIADRGSERQQLGRIPREVIAWVLYWCRNNALCTNRYNCVEMKVISQDDCWEGQWHNSVKDELNRVNELSAYADWLVVLMMQLVDVLIQEWNMKNPMSCSWGHIFNDDPCIPLPYKLKCCR